MKRSQIYFDYNHSHGFKYINNIHNLLTIDFLILTSIRLQLSVDDDIISRSNNVGCPMWILNILRQIIGLFIDVMEKVNFRSD